MVYGSSCLVNITTFVNPHLFWIFDVEGKQERCSLEKKLEVELNNKGKQITGCENEFVAVRDNDIWKRAIIKKVCEDKYECWLTDYGYLYTANIVYELPSDLLTLPVLTRQACLNDVVELYHECDYIANKLAYKPQKKFSEGLLKITSSYISNAESVIFLTERVIGDVLCGQLEIKKRNVPSFNLIKILLQKKNILVNKEIFNKVFKINQKQANVVILKTNQCKNVPRNQTNDILITDDAGIGRGYRRNATPKSHRPVSRNNYVQNWVDEDDGRYSDSDMSVSMTSDHSVNLSNSSTSDSGGNIRPLKGKALTPRLIKQRLVDLSKSEIKTNEDTSEFSPAKAKNLSDQNKSMQLNISSGFGKGVVNSVKLYSTTNGLNNESEDILKHNLTSDIEQKHEMLTNKSSCMSLNSASTNVHINENDKSTISGSTAMNVKWTKARTNSVTNGEHNSFVNLNESLQHKSNQHSSEYSKLSPSPSKQTRTTPYDLNENHLENELKTKDDKTNASENGRGSSMSSKLHGCIVPAGATISTKKRKCHTKGNTSSSLSGSLKSCKSKTEKPDKLTDVSQTSSSSDSDECQEPPKPKNMVVVGCKCKRCQTWNNDDIAGENSTFKDKTNVPKKAIYKPSPLLKTENCNNVIEIKTKKFKRNFATKIEKDLAPSLLVHGFCIPSPVTAVVDVPFHSEVHRALSKLNFISAKPIQTYIWPSIMRLMNVCMVNAPQTGKTMAYLPTICSFIFEKAERYTNLPKEKGPIALILCESVFKCQEIYDLFCTILNKTTKKINMFLATPPINDCLYLFKAPCDILITTPVSLVLLLKLRVINLKRLCHIVVEGADIILNKFAKEFDSIINVTQNMLEHRSCINTVQIITSSQYWTINLEKFIKKLYLASLVCIGAYLETALYGRADIQMHFIDSRKKMSILCDIMKDNYLMHKTIVLCNEENEVDNIQRALQLEGISVTAISSSMVADEIREKEIYWESSSYGKHSVLVCTDSTLNTYLSITNSVLLIHYSLPPDSWSIFVKRFKCLIDSYESPFSSQKSGLCKVHVFVDESCNKQFPKLYMFLLKVGTKLPQKFTNFCKKVKENKEIQKLESGTKLCNTLKLFGQCQNERCTERHILSREKDFSNNIPKSGIIKFSILSIQNVTIFTAKLFEHTDTQGKVRKIPDETETIGRLLNKYIENNKVYAECIEIGDLYGWLDIVTGDYHRCEVLKIISNHSITKLANEVKIKLIDKGTVKNTVNTYLFELPLKYKKLPAQGIEVYIANALPPDNEDSWSSVIKNKVVKMLENAEYNKPATYFTGRIILQIENTVWLDDIHLQEELTQSDDIVTKLTLKRHLLEKHLVSYNEEQLIRLYKICKDSGIELPNYECLTLVKKVIQVKQARPHWAYLESDNLNAVYFANGYTPHKFYVRLEKYDGLFQHLQKDIQEIIRTPFYPKINEVITGNCYLAKDPEGEDYCRVIVRNIKDDMIDCFFVDYGDTFYASRDELKHLPDKFITKLPFQAIECKLYGCSPPSDHWSGEAVDVLYKYCFETGTDIYNTLYISVLSVSPSQLKESRTHSVLVIDYSSEKPVLINQLLIDCGFAVTVENESLDIALPEQQEINDDSDDLLDFDVAEEKEYTLNEIKKMKETEQNNELKVDDKHNIKETSQNDEIADDGKVFDIEIHDPEQFLRDMIDKMKGKPFSPANKPSSSGSNLPPMKALPPASHYTPDLLWHQTETLVKMEIKLPNITECDLQVVRGKFFYFSTTTNEKLYKLNIHLFNSVNKTLQHTSGGPCVRIILEKRDSNEWPRLTSSEQKMRHIKYDVAKCNYPEGKKRAFLQFEPHDEEDDYISDHVIEIGSDFDYSDSDIDSESSNF